MTPYRRGAIIAAIVALVLAVGAFAIGKAGPTPTALSATAAQETSAPDLELASLTAYGHSYLTWPSNRTYLKRLTHRHGWDTLNAGFPGEQCKDTAARVIGANSATRWVPGQRNLVLVDCAANDLISHGAAGVTGYRNALRAIVGYTSLEGVLESSTASGSGPSLTTAYGPEWSGGSMIQGRGTITMWAADRAGSWWIGYYGITSTTNGGTFRLYADPGNRLLATVQIAGQALPSGGRSWTAAAVHVQLDQPAATFRVVKDDNLEGAYLDWWGHEWEDPTPRIFLMTQPYLSTAGKAHFPPATDAAVDAYNATLTEVAAECGPPCLVVDSRPGWDAETMLLGDGIHLNDKGNLHVADAFDAALRR